MSPNQQSTLSQYGNVPSSSEGAESNPSSKPQLGFESLPQSRSFPEHIQQARRADWVAFTGRYPYVLDAARLGFAIGHREDSSYQWLPDGLDLPVHFLDNNYQNADLDRFVSRVFEYEPEIAVIGDIYDDSAFRSHLDAADEIRASYPELELMFVPKTGSILTDGAIPDEFVLGYPNGNSPIQARDIAPLDTWRSLPHRLHILGGTPLQTLDAINQLTKPTVTDSPPADIAGLDWNGFTRYAESHGDYAAADGGWHRNLRDEYIPKRDLILYSLTNARQFWIHHDIWPDDAATLTPRSALQQATENQAVLDETNSQRDQQALAHAPSPELDRHDEPLCRTDETQAEIIEPLSPLAAALSPATASWAPAGALRANTAYDLPAAHSTDMTCAGCGQRLLANPHGTHTQAADDDATTLSASLVSYEPASNASTHDYESAATADASSHDIQRRSELHFFCSENCRHHTEHRAADGLRPSENIDLQRSEPSEHGTIWQTKPL